MSRGSLQPVALAYLNLLSGLLLYLAPLNAWPAWTGRESPGPSSRHTGLVISEIMYNPANRTDGRNLEFIEIYNSNPYPEDISGFRISGEIVFGFPFGAIIGATSTVVVASFPGDISAVYSLPQVYGSWVGSLGGTGTLRLSNRQNAILFEVSYSDEPPWPVAADGPGHSLVLTRPSLGENNRHAWDISDTINGSPGRVDPVTPDPLKAIVINEFLAAPMAPFIDYIELFNTGTQALDVAGCALTDSKSNDKFVFGPGSIIPPRGYLALDEFVLGFAVNRESGTLYFRSRAGAPNGARVIDSISYSGQTTGVSFGRFPDGTDHWRPLSQATPLAPNTAPRLPSVVINELMYAPPSGQPEDEFIELHNTTTNEIDLTAWQLAGGVTLAIPTNTVLPPNGYLVLAHNSEALQGRYPHLNDQNVVGNYDGELADDGDRVRLVRPADDDANSLVIEDQVEYETGGQWGRWSRRGGSSLERIDPRADSNDGSTWTDSAPSPDAAWTLVELTGALDNGHAAQPVSEIQIIALDAGEYLVDNVEVFRPAQPNLVLNGGFESGTDGWVIGGNHIESGADSDAFAGTSSLHVRASGPGDPGVNQVARDLPVALTNGTVTVRARVKWLRGHTNLLFRLYGNYLEAVGHLDPPATLGTPGLINSTALPNLGPAISDVRHDPVLPASNQPVVVTAQIHDPDGWSQPLLHYRLDPMTEIVTLPMVDNGANGDATAGDHRFSATLPGRPGGGMIAFSIETHDLASPPAASRYPSNPQRECLVHFGDAQGPDTLGDYHLWVAAANMAAWGNRPRISDEPIPCTLIYGTDRIIYEAGIRYEGDPADRAFYATPASAATLALVLPDDNSLLGATRLTLDTIRPAQDPTALRELTSFWMAEQLNLPTLHQRFVHVSLNGLRETARGFLVSLDRELPDYEYVRRRFRDDPAHLYRIADWHEFTDGPNPASEYRQPARLTDFSGASQPARSARWNWRKEPNEVLEDDDTPLFQLAKALNLDEPGYIWFTEELIDTRQWFRALALRHVLGDGNGYGYDQGRNAYVCQPVNGRGQLFFAKLNQALGGRNGRFPASDLFEVEPGETTLRRLYDHPYFRKGYLSALGDALIGPLQNPNLTGFLDSRHQALVAAGIAAASPFAASGDQGLSIPGWIATQSAHILAALPIVPFTIATNYIVASNNIVTLEGTAPFDGYSIYIGDYYPVTWLTPTTWRMVFPVTTGAQSYSVRLTDGGIHLERNLIVEYIGAIPDPRHRVVINEIHYAPATGQAAFVEIHNSDPEFSFDLSGWTLRGVGTQLPPGTLLTNGQYLVVAADRRQFGDSYGGAIGVGAEFSLPLASGGQELTLLNRQGYPIDAVAFSTAPPWPPSAAGDGHSLQTIDPTRDNVHVGNWGAAPPTPGAPNITLASLPPLPTLSISEIDPRNPTNFANVSGEYEPWIELHNYGDTDVSLDGLFLSNDYGNLTRWQFPPGRVIPPNGYLVVWVAGTPLIPGEPLPQASFRLNADSGSVALATLADGQPLILDSIGYEDVLAGSTFGSFGESLTRRRLHPTPGAFNLLPYYALFINEWMASNTTLFDPADGDDDDWFEIYNAEPIDIDLTGFALADSGNYWRVPDGARIPAHGFLLVWADDEIQQNGPGRLDLHAGFRLGASGDSLAIMDPAGRSVDRVVFQRQVTDRSEGRFPDGSIDIGRMQTASPRATNNPPLGFRPRLIAPEQRLEIDVRQGDSLTLTVIVSGTLPMGYIWWTSSGSAHFDINSHTNSLTVSNLTQTAPWSLQLSNAFIQPGFVHEVAYVTVSPDNDRDGIPDSWESRYLLDPSNPSDALWDKDGDGVSNRDEYLTDTNPEDAASALRLDITRPTPDSATVRFQAAGSKSYTVLVSDALEPGGTWNPLTAVPATGRDRIVNITNLVTPPDGPSGFFRVIIPAQP